MEGKTQGAAAKAGMSVRFARNGRVAIAVQAKPEHRCPHREPFPTCTG